MPLPRAGVLICGADAHNALATLRDRGIAVCTAAAGQGMSHMRDLPGIDPTGDVVFECSDDEIETPVHEPAPDIHEDPDVVASSAVAPADAGRMFGIDGLEGDCGISGLEGVLNGLRGAEMNGVAEMERTVLNLQREVMGMLAQRAGPAQAHAPVRSEIVTTESLALLERKIKDLEGAVGAAPAASQSVLNMVTLLDSRTSYLEPAALRSGVAKLQRVSAIMSDVVRKGQQGDFAAAAAGANLGEINKRVDEFRDKENMADPVPQLVDRLMTLRTVHERVDSVSSQIRAVAALRESTDASLKASIATLKTLSQDVPAAGKQIQANNEAITARIKRLSKNLALLEKGAA